MIIKTPIAAKCFHETANPLSDARYPFTLHAKPSINIKNSIDNGNFDYSESSKILYKESDIEQTPWTGEQPYSPLYALEK